MTKNTAVKNSMVTSCIMQASYSRARSDRDGEGTWSAAPAHKLSVRAKAFDYQKESIKKN